MDIKKYLPFIIIFILLCLVVAYFYTQGAAGEIIPIIAQGDIFITPEAPPVTFPHKFPPRTEPEASPQEKAFDRYW